MPVEAAIHSPLGIPGPIGLIHLSADDASSLDAMLLSLAPPAVSEGASGLRRILDGEHAVVVRWTPRDAHVMPHGGAEVMRRVVAALESAGALFSPSNPIAADDPLAHLSDALAAAASPLAINLLLDQPRRWATHPRSLVTPAHASMLRHLLRPPLVVAWGPPNIGKSTLLNALARSDVSIVAPEPGTTRDHVGVLLNLGGLVVRYADTPGVRADPHPVEADAIEISRSLVQNADLVLWCRDAGSPRPALPPTRAVVLPIDLRADLGSPAPPPGIPVCALDERSIRALSQSIRDVLVPGSALADPGAWPFWRC